ncbi:MAG: NlpC/P60 family protein [Coriobacteriia bacterium]|nr:NlpC/P60 family protein [Coriobacteriia bacterium]
MRRLLAAFLLALALLFGAVSVATADTYVVFNDPSLRTAVANQLVKQGQVSAGSDGTTLTPSDMKSLTVLSASGRGIVQLEGLQCAANVATLDLGGNEIANLTPLSGLKNLADLDLSRNDLDVSPGSPAMSVIAALESVGAHVTYGPQRAQLSQLAVSSSASTYGKSVTFSARIVPPGAALLGASSISLYHLETKIVTRRIKGKRKKVAVNYWRLRRTLKMQAGPAGVLSVKGRLPCAGEWQAQVANPGSADYECCTSVSMAFVVRDPRIDEAIGWARQRLGSHTWDHYCLRFVCDSYAQGARTSVRRYDTARQAAHALHVTPHQSANAPRGVWVFYDSTAGGHVGISLGNGTMINDYGGAGVEIMRIKDAGHYIGWAAPPLSPSINDWKQPPSR